LTKIAEKHGLTLLKNCKTRYPGEYEEITKEEYENSIKIANACLNWVENKIKKTEENKKPE
jgi:hypothetical protein